MNALQTHLLRTIGASLATIAAVRAVYVAAGWTPAQVDTMLLQAEKDGVVDLKAGNDPRRLVPSDCIRMGAGYLQFVVAR